jgi:hypothetical protein
LFAEAMEEERSLLIDIVGDVSEVSVTSSLSEDSSMGGGGSGDGAEAEGEAAMVVDPQESA